MKLGNLKTYTKEQIEQLKKAVIAESWKRGQIDFLLRPIQAKMEAGIVAAKSRKHIKYVMNSSRRIGKSFLLCLKAAKFALKYGKTRPAVRYAAPTQKALRNIVKPIFQTLFDSCPLEYRPKFITQDNCYRFHHNGGEIYIAGCNNGHEDDLRGTAAGLCLIDEAGSIDRLDYLINDILTPQLLTTDGAMIIASTPPITPVHPFVSYAQKAEQDGCYAKYTIHESGYDQDTIDQFCEEAGGEKSTTWRREYLCEFIVDEKFAVIPEWDDKYIQDVPRTDNFQYYQLYEGMDIGVRDKTVVLYGYYDFNRAALIVEDEIWLEGKDVTTDRLARMSRAKEEELWKVDSQKRKVHLRVSDNNNLILLQDLGQIHGLHFVPTSKDNLQAMVNQLRLWVSTGRVIVSPKCKQLIGCLKYGIWNLRREEFERSLSYGHFDALAALIYLVRNVDVRTNPIPQHLGISGETHYMEGIPKPLTQDAVIIEKLFGPSNKFSSLRTNGVWH